MLSDESGDEWMSGLLRKWAERGCYKHAAIATGSPDPNLAHIVEGLVLITRQRAALRLGVLFAKLA